MTVPLSRLADSIEQEISGHVPSRKARSTGRACRQFTAQGGCARPRGQGVRPGASGAKSGGERPAPRLHQTMQGAAYRSVNGISTGLPPTMKGVSTLPVPAAPNSNLPLAPLSWCRTAHSFSPDFCPVGKFTLTAL